MHQEKESSSYNPPDPSKVSVIADEIAQRSMHKETNEAINRLPDIANVIMSEEISWNEPPENAEQIDSVFSDLTMNDIPAALMDPKEAVESFLAWDMLNHCTNHEVPEVESALKFLREPQVIKLFEYLFWIVNVLKFQPDNYKLLKKLRKLISTSYTTTLSLCPNPKEEILSIVHICYGYMVHAMHHRIFVKQRAQFTIRFVLDCYHIVVYELTGLLVSDVYIYNQIERMFGEKFFTYKQEGILDLTNVDLHEGSVYLEKTKLERKHLEKLNLNNVKLSDASKREISEFGNQLTEKFNQCSKILHANNRTNLLLAKFEGELAKKMVELTNKKDFEEFILERASKINESQLRNEELKESGLRHNASIEIINIEDLDSKRKHTASSSNDAKLKRGGANQASLPILKIKQKFDCSQVSPPLQMVAKNVTASTKKKTIAFTSFNVPEFSVQKLSEIYKKYMKQNESSKSLHEKKNGKTKEKLDVYHKSNVSKHAHGSENLDKRGFPVHLKEKFMEFYMIRNVVEANKHLAKNNVEERGALKQLLSNYKENEEIDFEEVKDENERIRNIERERKRAEENRMIKSLYDASVDILKRMPLADASPSSPATLPSPALSSPQALQPSQAPLAETAPADSLPLIKQVSRLFSPPRKSLSSSARVL